MDTEPTKSYYSTSLHNPKWLFSSCYFDQGMSSLKKAAIYFDDILVLRDSYALFGLCRLLKSWTKKDKAVQDPSVLEMVYDFYHEQQLHLTPLIDSGIIRVCDVSTDFSLVDVDLKENFKSKFDLTDTLSGLLDVFKEARGSLSRIMGLVESGGPKQIEEAREMLNEQLETGSKAQDTFAGYWATKHGYALFLEKSLQLVKENEHIGLDLLEAFAGSLTYAELAEILMRTEGVVPLIDHDPLQPIFNIQCNNYDFSINTGSDVSKSVDLDLKADILAFDLLIRELPNFEPKSMEEVLELREALGDELSELRETLQVFVGGILSDPISNNFFTEKETIVTHKIQPKIRELRRKVRSIKSKRLVSIVKQLPSLKSVTPIAGSVLLGLPVWAGCALAAGFALSTVVAESRLEIKSLRDSDEYRGFFLFV